MQLARLLTRGAGSRTLPAGSAVRRGGLYTRSAPLMKKSWQPNIALGLELTNTPSLVILGAYLLGNRFDGRNPMYINWEVTTRFDPNSLEPSTHGIPIPSYGNYGGPNYSAGVENGTTPETPNPPPLDALDVLFYAARSCLSACPRWHCTTNSHCPADVHLVEAMYGLTQTDPSSRTTLKHFCTRVLATLTIGSKILTTPEEFAVFPNSSRP